MTLKGRVSPFGNPRIKACSQLPTAYRSVPRPSSPLGAKASTRCPCQTLDRFSHKPIQTRPKHPPQAKGTTPQSPKPTQRTKPGRNHDSGQVTCFSLARDTSLEIQTPPSGETKTPRQPAGSPIHISNNPRPKGRTAQTHQSKGRKTQTAIGPNSMIQDAELNGLK